MLNNKGADAMTPIVTLFSAVGDPYRLPTITVPGANFVELDLASVAQEAGPHFGFGSIEVVYYGDKLELGAQVVVRNVTSRLQFDEQLTYATPTAFAEREAVWWMPAPSSRLNVVLSNRTDQIVSARVTLHSRQRDQGAQEARTRILSLAPRALEVLEFGASAANAGPGVGGLTVTHDGVPGSITLRGFVLDTAHSYSAPVIFSAPSGAKTSTYHAAGFRLQSGGAATLPVILARNITNAETTVRGRLIVSRGSGAVDVLLTPETGLAPGETKRLDLTEVWTDLLPKFGPAFM